MKRIIIIIAITWIITNLFSITIPGATYNTDTTWTLADSPYLITGDINVNPNVTLTIEAGVTVELSIDVQINVYGIISAIGINKKEITFTSTAQNRTWDGIFLTNCRSAIFDYCIITRTKNQGAIVAENCSSITVTNSDIYDNNIIETGGLSASALYFKNIENLNISNSKIFNNSTLINDHYVSSTCTIKITEDVNDYYNIIEFNKFNDNKSSYGGGLHCYNESVSSNIEINKNIINNNFAENNGGGIFLSGRNLLLTNNIISNNTSLIDGGGILISSDQQYENFVYENIIIEKNTVSNNVSGSGGGLKNSHHCVPTVITIRDNNFYYNSALIEGGGLYLMNLYPYNQDQTIFESNSIFMNSAQSGGGLYCDNSKYEIIKSNFLFNNSSLPGSAVVISGGGNTTESNGILDITNSIIWGNRSDNSSENQIVDTNNLPSNISFSCIENGIQGSLNFDHFRNVTEDPLFLDKYTYNWHLGENSSCIGTGQNGTDIGVYSYSSANNSSKFIHSVHSGINWISFPKLDRNIETNPDVPINTPLAGLGSNGSLITNDQGLQCFYLNNNWSSLLFNSINTTKGYKLTVNNNGSFDVYGKTVNPLTTIELFSTPVNSTFENWIGYFIPQSQTPQEAFGETMNSLLSIKTETWSMTRASLTAPWFTGSTPKTINYGDMVVVKTGLDASISFQWNSIASEAEAMLVAPAQLFSYTQQADYTPVYVTYSDENPPAEIAVLANGVVRGASVYEGEVTQINAYLTPEDADAEITFAFAYDSKQALKQITSYSVYKDNDYITSNFPLSYQPATPFYAVKIGEKANTEVMPMISQVRNYPNPFNPETTIDFMTAKEGNVKITIFNIKGQKVCELFNGVLPNGSHQLNWNGKDQNNNKVGTGIYFYTISTNQSTVSRKMTLIK